MNFSRELQQLLTKADMTVADAAVFFERSYATVRTWVKHQRTPYGPQGREALIRLEQLRRELERGAGLPVPTHLCWTARADHIREIREHVKRHARVSKVRASV